MVGNGEGAIQVTENGQEYAGESSVKQQSLTSTPWAANYGDEENVTSLGN
jgi:hypothetical protein